MQQLSGPSDVSALHVSEDLHREQRRKRRRRRRGKGGGEGEEERRRRRRRKDEEQLSPIIGVPASTALSETFS